MIKSGTRARKRKADVLDDDDLVDNTPSEVSGDGEAEDGAGNHPTPSNGRKKQKVLF
jgi:hypothetical protein